MALACSSSLHQTLVSVFELSSMSVIVVPAPSIPLGRRELALPKCSYLPCYVIARRNVLYSERTVVYGNNVEVFLHVIAQSIKHIIFLSCLTPVSASTLLSGKWFLSLTMIVSYKIHKSLQAMTIPGSYSHPITTSLPSLGLECPTVRILVCPVCSYQGCGRTGCCSVNPVSAHLSPLWFPISVGYLPPLTNHYQC